MRPPTSLAPLFIFVSFYSGFPELIETIVLPTVGEEIDSQYVCITLQVMPTVDYPDIKPNYQLRNPRGLDDNGIETIRAAVEQKLSDSIGSPMVFDLIDVIREHLTSSNLPSGQCVVCLYGFQDGDAFTKTVCYHHLHSYCLARHLDASKNNYDEEFEKLPAWQRQTAKPYQAYCPVCREPIDYDPEPLRSASPPCELQNAPDFEVTSDLKGLQARMADLYMHQKKRGGIIDLNAEDSNVISIDSEENQGAVSIFTFPNTLDICLFKKRIIRIITFKQRRNRKSNTSNNAAKVATDATRRTAKNGAEMKRNADNSATNNKKPTTAATTVPEDDAESDEDDTRRHRRGGNRHRRNNGYHHHRHHNRVHHNNTEPVTQAACSSNTR